jgi:hypothetical protein
VRVFSGLLFVALATWPSVVVAADPPPTIEDCLKSSEEGQRLRDGGKYVRARELFTTCAMKTCPAVVQRECVAALGEVDRNAPSVVFVVRNDAGDDVPDARLVLDEAPLVQRTLGTPVNVDAGEHVLRAVAIGHKTSEQRFVASVGEKSRVIAVRLTRDSASTGPSTPTAVGAPSPSRSTEPRASNALSRTRGSPLVR